jgi:hypothetical protein
LLLHAATLPIGKLYTLSNYTSYSSKVFSKMSYENGFHRLGKDGSLVPAIGFGLMGLSSHSYGPPPEDEDRFAILDRAWELGARFWDSSEYDSATKHFTETLN